MSSLTDCPSMIVEAIEKRTASLRLGGESGCLRVAPLLIDNLCRITTALAIHFGHHRRVSAL